MKSIGGQDRRFSGVESPFFWPLILKDLLEKELVYYTYFLSPPPFSISIFPSLYLFLCLSMSLCHTHTLTHTTLE